MSKKRRNIPELRFPKFRGKDEWDEEKFNEIYSFKVTNSFSRDKLNYDNGTVKNIHYGDIHTKFSTLFDIKKEIVPYINPSIALEKIKLDNYCIEGDMIFADASEDLDGVGESIEVVNINNEKLLSGLHTLLVRQKEKKLITGFGGYLFKSPTIRNRIKKESQGAKVLGISKGRLSNIDIFFPKDEKEQQKIVDCLSSIDNLIETQSKKVEVLKEHKKGLVQNHFPKDKESVPEFRFPEFRDDGEWKEKSIDQISKNVTAGGTPSTSKKEYWNGSIRWMNSGELNLKKVYEVQGRISEEGLKNSSTKLIPKECILIGLAGQGKTRGTVAINMVELCTNQSIASIFPNKKTFDSNFLYHYLDSKYDELRRLSTGGEGRGGLNLRLIKAFKIKIPSLLEQQKIADCLSSIDNLIESQTKKVEKLREHKKGLMQKLFPADKE